MANAALGLLPAELDEHPHRAARRFLDGPDPWGAITHQEFVAYLEGYVDRHRLPVRTGVAVQQQTREDGAYRVTTDRETLLACAIVIAIGNQNRQVRPPWSSDLPTAVRQVDFLCLSQPGRAR